VNDATTLPHGVHPHDVPPREVPPRSMGSIERLVDRVFCALRVDALAGGKHGRVMVDRARLDHPATVRVFRWLRWLLVAETVVGMAAIVVAVVLSGSGESIPWAVWFRATVVLLITLSLYVFAWRAQLGYYWAYSRLTLFSRIFPVVTVVIAAIPGLYPWWMVVEQLVFSAIMIGIAVWLSTPQMRAAFPKPARR
jgi:hypothetical protein